MKYMIMECHKGYAVALDEEGRFLRVANMHYEIGQQVEEVTVYKDKTIVPMRQRLISYASVVVCMLCVMIGSLQLFVISYGNVHLRINPEIDLSVNRLCYITKLEGVNQDGRLLLEGYSYRGKKVEQVLNELTEKAMEDGYLAEGGSVYVDVDSVHVRWKQKHLDGLAKSMSEHFENKIQILSNTTEKKESGKTDTVKQENNQNKNKNNIQKQSGYESSEKNETKKKNIDVLKENDIQKSTKTSSNDNGNKSSNAVGSDGQHDAMKGNTHDGDDDDGDDDEDDDDSDDDDSDDDDENDDHGDDDDMDDDADDDDEGKQSSAGHKNPPKDSHSSDVGNQQQKDEEPDDREESNKEDDNDDDNDDEDDSDDDDEGNDEDDDDHDDDDDDD